MSLLKTPLLIWVDDHAARGESAKLIAHAKELGICVVLLTSTIKAQNWIMHNIGTKPA